MAPPATAVAGGGLASLLLQKQKLKQKLKKPKGGDANAAFAGAVGSGIGDDSDGKDDDAFLPSAPPAEGGAAFGAFLGSLMKGDRARRKAERKAMARKREEEEEEEKEEGIAATQTAAAAAADADADPLPPVVVEEDDQQQQQRPDPSDAFLDCPAAAAEVAAPASEGNGSSSSTKKKNKLAAAELDRPLPRSWAECDDKPAAPSAAAPAPAARWLLSESEAPEQLPGFPRSPPASLAAAGIRPRVAAHWRELLAADARAARERGGTAASSPSRPPPFGEFASEEQACFLGALRTYRDILFCSRPYPTEPIVAKKAKEKKKNKKSSSSSSAAAAADAPSTISSASSFSRDDLQDAYLLHAASHVVASATRIRKNNEALAAAEAAARAAAARARAAAAAAAGGGKGNGDGDGAAAAAAAAAAAVAAAAAAPPPRDQGFARPKVLLLLPLRSVALRAVLRLANLLQRETRVDSIRKKQRFEEEFGAEEDSDDEDDDEDDDEEDESSDSDADVGDGDRERRRKRKQEKREKKRRRRRRSNLKPRDHRALFSGNSDDHFRLGVRLTRGAVTLYSDFDDSDIIVASPLGLATYLQSGGVEKTTKGPDGKPKKLSAKERARAVASAADCLSSLELVVVDRADALLMQNWAHVASLLASAVNNLPRSPPANCDVMRVRECHLSGQSRRARQLVVLSSFASPSVVAAWTGAAASVAGRARLVVRHEGRALEAAPEAVQLSFERVRPLASPAAASASASASAPSSASAAAAPLPAATADAEARFAHFASVAWPRLCGNAAAVGDGAGNFSSASSTSSTPPPGLLLFVPSYFDYVRVKKFLRAKGVPLADMGEYVPPREAARARTAFFARGVGRGAGAGALAAATTTDSSKKPPVALLTERSHFFHRAVVRGVSSAFFYQLPDHPRFFEEVVSWVGKRRREKKKTKKKKSRGGESNESEREESDDGGEEEEAFEHVPGRAEVLFSSVDALALERVVGTERCKRMLKGAEPAYVFC